MKKIFLLFTVIFSSLLMGQNKLEMGVKLGGNGSFVFENDKEGYDGKYSFHAGFFLEYKLFDRVFIQPEILYSEQGDVNSSYYHSENNNGTMKISLNYLQIPVTLKLYLSNRFNIQIGGQIGFLTSAKTLVTARNDGKEHESDISELLKKEDYGVNFGLGIDINDKLSIEARYNLGVNNILKADSSDAKLTNGVIQLGLLYSLYSYSSSTNTL